MNIETLCMGCMAAKGTARVCPRCGYQEEEQRGPLVLPYRTILNDKFLIGKVLGKPGGFGITYLAWDLILQTTAAVKEYLPRECAARDTDHTTIVPFSQEDQQTFSYGLEQFLQEAQTLVSFNHPHVVRIREFFRANNTAYLVMDYYKGISLEEYLSRKGGKVPENVALKIMLPVLSGLREVHRKGFLHRDIKPNNIYLTHDRNIILLDFGAARIAMGERSKSLSVVLTPGFTPYEQYHSRGKQGPWTDIYACGATLYYLLTGVKPLDAIERAHQDDLAPPDHLIPNVSPHVNQAIMQALAVNPEDRPQHIQKFQQLLMAKRGLVPASQPNLPTQQLTVVQSQTRLQTGTRLELRPQAQPQPQSSKKRQTVWMWGIASFLIGAIVVAGVFVLSSILNKPPGIHVPPPSPPEVVDQEGRTPSKGQVSPQSEESSAQEPSETQEQPAAPEPLRPQEQQMQRQSAPDTPPAPPPEAIEACQTKNQGDSCTFSGFHQETLSGTCAIVRSGELACRPEGHTPPGGPQQGKSPQNRSSQERPPQPEPPQGEPSQGRQQPPPR